MARWIVAALTFFGVARADNHSLVLESAREVGLGADGELTRETKHASIAALSETVRDQGAEIADLRARLLALELRFAARCPPAHNSTSALESHMDGRQPTDPGTAQLRRKFDEIFLQSSQSQHDSTPPVALIYLDLRQRDAPGRARRALEWSAPGPTLSIDVLATVTRDGSVIFSGPLYADLYKDTVADPHSAKLCDARAACAIIAAAGGLLPSAVLVTGDASTASASVSLWAVQLAHWPSNSPPPTDLLSSVPPAISVEGDEGRIEVRHMCSAATPGTLPLSFLTWSLGVGVENNRVFVGTSDGRVIHLFRNCSVHKTYAFSAADGTAVTAPIVALARHSYVLAVAAGASVRFVQLDSHREWAVSCGLGESPASVVSLAFDAAYPSLLWAGMGSGSALLLRAHYMDPLAQRRSTCAVVRHVPPPAACLQAREIEGYVAPGSRGAEEARPETSEDSSTCSPDVSVVTRRSAAALVSQRGSVLIGSAACGLAVYSVSWAASAANISLLALSDVITSSAALLDSTVHVRIPPHSLPITTCTGVVVMRPAVMLALGSARSINERQRRGGRSSDPLSPLSVSFIRHPAATAARVDEVANCSLHCEWQLSSLGIIEQAAEPTAVDTWATIMSSVRIPLILAGLAVGAVHQVWLRAKRQREVLAGSRPKRSRGAPNTGDEADDGEDWPGAGGDVMRTLLQRMSAPPSVSAGGALSLHAAVKAAGLTAGSSTRGGASSAATAAWVRAAMGESGPAAPGPALRRSDGCTGASLQAHAQSALRPSEPGRVGLATRLPLDQDSDDDSDGTFGAT